MILRIFAAVALLASPVVSLAQSNSPDVPCELHVWPGSGLNSVYSGWFHGGIVNGAVNGRDGYPVIPSEPIDSANQVALLKKSDLSVVLKQPAARIIFHDAPLPSRTIRTTATRIEATAVPCYAEFIVDDVFFQQDLVDGSFLKILFRYRQFGADAAPEKVFGTWVKTRLRLLPPKPETDLTAAADELRSAFSNNIQLFGEALNKPAKTKR